MRVAVALLFVTGCGLNVVGTFSPDADAGADADASVLPGPVETTTPPIEGSDAATTDAAIDAPVDAGPCPAGCKPSEVCDGTCIDVAGALDAFRYEIPCTNSNRPACGIADATPNDKVVTMKGTAGKTYDVVLRLRGVIEQRKYAGDTVGTATGTNHSFFAQGGSEGGSDTWNIYALRISQPAFTWHLNSGVSNNLYSDLIDYQATIRVEANATVTIHADSVDLAMANNQGPDNSTTPLVVTSISATPFAGQYIQFDPVSVSLVP